MKIKEILLRTFGAAIIGMSGIMVGYGCPFYLFIIGEIVGYVMILISIDIHDKLRKQSDYDSSRVHS